MTTEQKSSESTALAKPAWVQGMPDSLMAEAGMVVASGYYPTVKSVAQAAFKMWVAEQLGFTKIEGLQYVHVIEPPANSSRPPSIQVGYPLVAARIQRSPTYEYRVEEKTATRCAVGFWKASMGGARKLGTSVFTIEDAKRQGLIRQGSNWEKIPETMLFARAITNGAKTYCPSVLGGVDVGEDDRFVIEGSARVVEDPPTETHGEEFAPANPWSLFWPQIAEMGLTKEDVHAELGVAPEDGALAEAVNKIAQENNKAVAQVLAELLDYFASGKVKADEPDWETPGAPPHDDFSGTPHEQGELLTTPSKRKGRDDA